MSNTPGWYSVLATSPVSGELEATSVDLYSLRDAAREARRARGVRVIVHIEHTSGAAGTLSHTATVVWQGTRVPAWLGETYGTGDDASRAARAIALTLAAAR